MKIEVMSALGRGPTELAAFHDALARVGLGDANLIVLSSVIPKGSVVELRKKTSKQYSYGSKFYVVLSYCKTSKTLTNVYAGLGWYLRNDGSGYFVEITGDSRDAVEEKIKKTLIHMQELKNEQYKLSYEIVGGMCENQPLCALVIATYEPEEWRLQS